jgi:ABC-type nitrate/sulfonate/bicarbonate transport system substrate-binding protein
MKLKNLLKYVTLMMTILTILTLVACSGDDGEEEEPLTDTSIQLSWVHTVEFAGFYEAVDKGFYAEQGLNVRLDAGGYDADGNYIFPLTPVLSGATDFGVAGGDVLLSARASGEPVVGIAAIYQRNPVMLVSLAEKDIRLPQDLKGKRIGIDDPGTATYIVYRAFLASQGIDVSEVEEIVQKPPLDPLINGEIDVRTGFVTNQPVVLQQMGYDVNIILPSDYGIDLYSNVIFTTEDTIANRPDLVEKFLRATIEGFDAAIDDPKHAAELSVSYNSDLTLENELASMNFSLPLIRPAGRLTGMMEKNAWDMTHQVMLDQGILEAPIDYNAAFTLEFLNTIHGQ